MNHLKLISILIVLYACASSVLVMVDAKRSYSIGRSRKKSANINVRRKGAIPDAPRPAVPDTAQIGAAPHPIGVSGAAMGSLPAYSGIGHHSVAAPPYGNPPSYQQAMAGRLPMGNSPARGSSGLSYQDSTSFRGLGQGHNSFGAPSQTAGLYNAHGGGGFSGPGVYGSGYGYGAGGSSSPFSFGNIVAGLAVWNLARGLGGRHHEQHVYIHKSHELNEAELGVDSIIDSISSTMMPSSAEIIADENDDQTDGPIESVTDEPQMDPHFYATIHPSLLIYAQNVGTEYRRSKYDANT